MLEHTRLQIATDQTQYTLVVNAPRDPCHQQVVIHSVEEGFQVKIDHPAVTGGDVGLHGRDGLLGAPLGAVAVTRLGEARVEDRHQYLGQRLLD